MTMAMNFREVEVTADETDQKNSGWHGPLILNEDTAIWIQNALDESNLDLIVRALPSDALGKIDGHVIIAGFGLAGRCVADLLERAGLPYTIVEQNPVTVTSQKALGRSVIQGDVTETKTLNEAGLATAAVLALTIPDEEAVLAATSLARKLQPEVYIIARTNYSSKGMRASQLGADDVIKAEQAVALQFYDRLSRRIRPSAAQDSGSEVYVKVAPKPQEVDSSMMENISYDEAVQELSVTFKNGSVYHYFDVEKPIFDGLEQSASKGRFFIRHIRPWYKFERIS